MAVGAGAGSRSAIGTVVVGGPALASILTLFVTLALYDMPVKFARPANAVAFEPGKAPSAGKILGHPIFRIAEIAIKRMFGLATERQKSALPSRPLARRGFAAFRG